MSSKLYRSENECYTRALPDEPYFVLLARDLDAPDTVKSWAWRRGKAIREGYKPAVDKHLVTDAKSVAYAMKVWRCENFGAWHKQQLEGKKNG